jgi:hypothetical protein
MLFIQDNSTKKRSGRAQTEMTGRWRGGFMRAESEEMEAKSNR